MVDYGTGSGVLAAAAVLLGAEHVVAVDIDFEVLTHARQNFLVSLITEDGAGFWVCCRVPASICVLECVRSVFLCCFCPQRTSLPSCSAKSCMKGRARCGEQHTAIDKFPYVFACDMFGVQYHVLLLYQLVLYIPKRLLPSSNDPPRAALSFPICAVRPCLDGARLRQLNGVGDKVSALHGREVSIGDLSAEVGQQSHCIRGVSYVGRGSKDGE